MKLTKEERKSIRKAKQEKRDLERYGIKPGEVKYEQKQNKKKLSYKPLLHCLSYYKDYKWGLTAVVIFATLLVSCSIAYPILLQNLIDLLSLGNMTPALKYIFILVGIDIAISIINYFWDTNLFKINNLASKKLENDLIKNILTTKSQKFDTTNSGAVIDRLTTDKNEVLEYVVKILDYLFFVVKGIGYTVIFFTINIWLGIVLIAGMFIYYFIDSFRQKVLYKFNKKTAFLSDKTTGLANETVRSIRDIKLLNCKTEFGEKYKTSINYRTRANIDKIFISEKIYLSASVAIFLSVLAFWLTAFFFMLNGMISLGSMTLCLVYATHCNNLIVNIVKIRTESRKALVHAERVEEILSDNYPKETFGNKEIKKPKGHIVFDQVNFEYENGKPVLKNFNLDISPNKCVAFVGKSGQGKSTILNLIPKMYEINGGKILIDGVNIYDLSENGLRNLISVVPQMPYIFNATIRENLQIVKPDLTEDEMFEVCKKAEIHDFIMTRKENYNSVVGENGLVLSGGQRQRLAIARALLKKSKIILFDEATSALDNESQEKIKNVIMELSKNHTIIIVAHRLSTIIDADEICFMEGGEIIASGTHEELLNTCVQYKKLYKVESKKKN